MMVDTVTMNIGRSVGSLNALQDQLSSGKRLRRPSDDPASLSRALVLRSDKAQNEQYLRNIASARGWLDASDSALDHMSNVLGRARNLALRSASDTLGGDEMERLAVQVEALLEEAEQASNSSQEGKYLFAGRQVTTAPFDIGRSPMYGGDTGGITREIDRGVEVAVNTLSSEVSVSVTDSIGTTSTMGVMEGALTVLEAMKEQLASRAAVSSTQLAQLTDCLESVAELRGNVGARMNRLDATQQAHTDNQVDVAAALSRAEDADVAEVITKLMMQESVYNAALQAGARVIQPSLMDFLR